MSEFINIPESEQKRIINEYANNKKKGKPPKEVSMVLRIAAKTMHEAGSSVREIARELKVSPQAAYKLIKVTKELNIENLENAKEGFSNEMSFIVAKLLRVATDDEYIRSLGKKGFQLIMAIGTLIDKILLLSGKPNQIVEARTVVSQAQEKIAQIEELEKVLRASIANDESSANLS